MAFICVDRAYAPTEPRRKRCIGEPEPPSSSPQPVHCVDGKARHGPVGMSAETAAYIQARQLQLGRGNGGLPSTGLSAVRTKHASSIVDVCISGGTILCYPVCPKKPSRMAPSVPHHRRLHVSASTLPKRLSHEYTVKGFRTDASDRLQQGLLACA